MRSAIRWRPQPATGSRKESGARQAPSSFDLPAAEAHILRGVRPNLLLVGPRSATDAALRELRPRLVTPIYRWCGEAGLPLPPDGKGTLVLQEVARLTAAQQAEFLEWLTRIGRRVQVVSTAGQSLFALVTSGEFRDDLYYRLNMMRFDVTPQGTPS